MALTPLSALLAAARAGRYAVGYFEAWDTYSLEAVAAAAEAERAPVVLGFGGLMMDQAWFARFGIEPLGAYARAVAERLSVPAAVILNEALDPAHARRGCAAGYNVVMLAGGHLPPAENVALNADLVTYAHARGVEVQAECGELPTFGGDAGSGLTDPGDAAAFVAATGVDVLAVAIGNEHLRTAGASPVQPAHLAAVRDAVDVPLSLHGGSGLPPAALGELIDAGASLIHVGTVLKQRFFAATRAAYQAAGEPFDYQTLVGSRREGDLLKPGGEAVAEVVGELLRRYGSAGKAAAHGH